MNKALLTIALSALWVCGLAQQKFKYKADVQKADSTAFYRIALRSEVLAKCKTDMADLRILNQKGKEVPFIYGTALPNRDESRFVVFGQVKYDEQTDSLTTIIVRNELNEAITQLSLRLRNTTAERLFTLSGSDDLKNWFAIKEDVTLAGATAGVQASVYEQQINLPASNYKYFKVSINNKHKEPVKILQAGVYTSSIKKPAFTRLQGTGYQQKDTGHISRITLSLKDSFLVNKIHLNIAGTKYYRRDITIYQVNGKQRNYIGDDVLNSADTNGIYLNTKAKTIELVINNDDNPPLDISSAEVYSMDRSVIAYLNKGENYRLVFGDAQAKNADYDLKFFTDSIDRNLTLLQTSNVINNPDHQPEKSQTKPAIPGWVIWVAIIAVLLILAALTFKMAGEVGNRNKS